ncbi:MAG TPA: mitochondrial fission ELM1 family protein [Geminicoccaceae bacterium]
MAVARKTREGSPHPRTWVMMGHKAGDNSQILALAEGLGWPFEIKHLVYRPTELLTNLLAPLTLLGVVRRKSSPLVPPWPDLIISAGRRNEPPCRWIQRRADKRVRLVHVGRPWARIENFDLVVTTPQYRLPKRPNVLHNTAPLQRVADERLGQAATLWAPRLAHLPRPYTAVMVGGNAGPYVLDTEAATLLGRAASAFATAQGGSLLLSTSARTPKEAIPALEAAIDCPADVFRWTRNAAENPYLGYLALADSIIVTCESMSMLTEACATSKPVYMFDLHTGPENRWPLLESLIGKVDSSWWRRVRRLRLQPLVFRIAFAIGPTRMTRDVRIIHRQLQAQGRAVWLGEAFPEGPPPTPLDDVPRAVARVKALFEESVGARHAAARATPHPRRARLDGQTEAAAL